MTATARNIADVIVAAIAVWFVLDATFDDLPARGFANAVAVFVLASSLWRIWRRSRGRP